MHGRHTTPGGRETWPWVARKLHMCMVSSGGLSGTAQGSVPRPCNAQPDAGLGVHWAQRIEQLGEHTHLQHCLLVVTWVKSPGHGLGFMGCHIGASYFWICDDHAVPISTADNAASRAGWNLTSTTVQLSL